MMTPLTYVLGPKFANFKVVKKKYDWTGQRRYYHWSDECSWNNAREFIVVVLKIKINSYFSFIFCIMDKMAVALTAERFDPW